MTELADLGFFEGIIGETIISTFDEVGQSNAAPMGVINKGKQRLLIRPYISSLTYKNLEAKRRAVVNVTIDPELFYKTAFKEVNPAGKVPREMFEKAESVDAPRLKKADAFIEVAVAEIDAFEPERAEVLCNVKLIKARKGLPKIYCRALFATIEAIVHSTRIQHFLLINKNEKEYLRLLERVKICHDVVIRTAPNSRYSEIMEDLIQRIKSWRKKDESLR